LDRVQDGLLFYYFGNGDLVSHMMWRAMDPGHPAYKLEDAQFADTVKKIYEQFDGIVGKTLPRIAEGATLVVMSDHGFTSWRRAFHLNTWLKNEGYLTAGYAKGTRSSNESALGKLVPEVITDNQEEWNGDHCMDPNSVPGILFTSRPLKKPAAKLDELAAAVLAEFGVEGFPKR